MAVNLDHFKQAFTDITNKAREVMCKDEFHAPTVFGFVGDTISVVQIRGDFPAGASYAPTVEQVVRRLGLEAFIFISEAWMLQKTEDVDVQKWQGQVHTHPDKVEVLVAIASHPRWRAMKLMRMERDATHGVLFSDQDILQEGAGVQGAVVEIIPLEEQEH